MSKHNIPVTVVDNFFETPSLIRQMALAETFTKGNGVYPGTRTRFLHQIDPMFARYFNQKVFSLFYDFDVHHVNLKVEAMFQLISKDYEEGWIHNDLNYENRNYETDWEVAGLVYLSPQPFLDGGTSIYSIDKTKMAPMSKVAENKEFKRKFYNQEITDPAELAEYRLRRDSYNNTFNETVKVNNVYNRLVVYDAAEFHRGNKFFGSNKDDSRLTLVFFAKMKPIEWVSNPIIRSRSVYY
jgi:hypothetical protein